MSMIGLFRRIPATTYATLQQDPSSIRKITSAGRGSPRLAPAAIEKLKNAPKEGWAQLPETVRARLQQMLREEEKELPADESLVVSVEKMWQALHFLVTGNAFEPGPAEAAFILGGDPCGPDTGYGPARILSPSAVGAIARGLPEPEALRAVFDPQKLTAAQVYPGVWDEDPEELWEEVAEYYSRLLLMYREAAAAGDAVVSWIS